MSNTIFMLVDVQNFYISCERAFQVALQNKPTIVVGNGDKVIVALSQEAKKLGLFRGQPLFQCEHLVRKHHIRILSSNFALYDSLSRRLMALLREYSPQLEEFSIDEAFGVLNSQEITDLPALGKTLQSRIYQWLGLPVRVSFAPSKVLTKIGEYLLRRDGRYHDVIDLTTWTEPQLTELLELVPVAEIFGIGSRYAQLLTNYGITTARQLRDADEDWVKRKFTVRGARILQELRGVSCFPLQPRRKPRQHIVYARSFGRFIRSVEELEEAVCDYTARAAVRLREQELLVGRLTVFVSGHSPDSQHPAYANDFTLDLRYPTAFTPALFTYAQQGARAIYREGLPLRKAGVVLSRITPAPAIQLDLFGEQSLVQWYQEMQLMALLDALNRIMGQGTLRFAVQGTEQPWRMRQERLSPRFTTRWKEILTI
jgi:DNA polymerase V